MHSLNVNEICKSELTVETLASFKHEEIIIFFEQISPLNGMKMPWHSVCSLLLFSFRTNGKKGHLVWMRITFVIIMVIFFLQWYLGSCLITATFKIHSQQL